ncbi:unnamed protein product [Hymenolepis diminuta]|uniref:Uncharacterized protein n=1 Tax=Hymenolepis diminuta TaxID=6216 RepID=A0A564ZAR4_HYMDI|nr:unnamed protein product [Hymenolepis diminuta]
MTHNPYLPFQNAPINASLFYNRLLSPKKYICAHALARPYPITHACPLLTPTLPNHFLSSSAHSPLSLSLVSTPL